MSGSVTSQILGIVDAAKQISPTVKSRGYWNGVELKFLDADAAYRFASLVAGQGYSFQVRDSYYGSVIIAVMLRNVREGNGGQT